MRLYVKQKVFSFKDKFYVMDELGSQRYYVEGEFPSIGKKLHIYDMSGQEIAFLRQKLISFLGRFFIIMNGVEVAEIVRQFAFFKDRFVVGGLDWEVQGSILAHDYEIYDRGHLIARIHKVWMSFGDSFEIEIADGQNEGLVLSVVLAIDCVLDQRNS